MSVISFDDSYVGATSVSGEGATSYTCPSNKRAELIVTMTLSYIYIDFFAGNIVQFINKVYNFKSHLQPNDVVVFAQSGNGTSGAPTNIACSFTKNSILQESKSLSVTTGGARYSANITYSVKEMLN